MSASLDSLSRNLPKDSFIQTSKAFEKLKLITRKRIYPYEYMDSFEKFENTNLPLQEELYTKLTESKISNQECKHTKKV